jgi:S-adenosyl methyltransferase
VAHPARIYDFWLGGKDNFAADRQAAQDVMRACPQVVASARANRAFHARVVHYLAAQAGVRQFLDIGAGLPGPPNTHEVAQAAAPDCRVVYCDNDEVVLTHARALLVSDPAGVCAYVDADVRDPGAVVDQVAQTLDFTRPVAVLLLALLHFLPETDNPTGVVAALVRRLAPGSFVAVSHLTGDFDPEQVGAAVDAYNAGVAPPVTPRTHAQVSGLFGELSLVAPGVVPVTQWRPSAAGLPQRRTADLYAGLASISEEPVTAVGSGPAALEQLATALGPGFITTLVTGGDHRPRLSVISRDTGAAVDVYADEGEWFWWPWAEQIAAIDDPLAAACHITAALRGGLPAGGAAASRGQAVPAEPTPADEREHPGWECVQGVSGSYAEHAATGTQANGEDPSDLRDQIKAAEARAACQREPGGAAPGTAGTL